LPIGVTICMVTRALATASNNATPALPIGLREIFATKLRSTDRSAAERAHREISRSRS
jgi:hypothetical protein